MPELTAPDVRTIAPEKTEAEELTGKKKDLLLIAPKMLAQEAQRIGAKDTASRTSGEKALLLYDQLLTGVDLQGKTEPFIGGKPLTLPRWGIVIDDGTELGRERDFREDEVAIAGISSLVRTEDGDFYICPLKDAKTGNVFFVDKKGNEKMVAIIPSGGESEKDAFDAMVASQEKDGYKLLQTEVPLEAVAGAQLRAEETSVTGALDDDQKRLLEPFIASLPQYDPKGEYKPTDGIGTALENVAQSLGMLQRKDVHTVVDVLPADDKNAQTLQDRLKKLDGQIIVLDEDLEALFQGLDTGLLMDKIVQSLNDNITKLRRVPDEEEPAARTARKTALTAVENQLASKDRLVQKFADIATQRLHEQQHEAELAKFDALATGVFKTQIENLELKIDNKELEGRELLEANNQLGQLYLAREAVGQEYGAMVRYAVLSQLRTTSSGAAALVTNESYHDAAILAQEQFYMFLESKGITDDAMRGEIVAKLQTPDGILELAQDPRFASIGSEFIKGTFGTEDAAIYDLIDQAASAHQNLIDSTTSKKLKEFLKKNPGKRSGILALILLSIAAAPFAAAVVAVPTLLGGISKQG